MTPNLMICPISALVRHPPAPPGTRQGKPRQPQPLETPWEALIRKGKERGFVTNAEIGQIIKFGVIAFVRSVQQGAPVPEPWSLIGPSGERERVYDAFRAMGIDVR